jgi:hypothetical protein
MEENAIFHRDGDSYFFWPQKMQKTSILYKSMKYGQFSREMARQPNFACYHNRL